MPLSAVEAAATAVMDVGTGFDRTSLAALPNGFGGVLWLQSAEHSNTFFLKCYLVSFLSVSR